MFNIFNDKVQLYSLRQLARKWFSPERSDSQNIEVMAQVSKYSLNEIVADLKRNAPETFVRWKCEFYDRQEFYDLESQLDIVSLYQNCATSVSSSNTSISIDSDKYLALEKEVTELKKQVAFLMSTQTSSSNHQGIALPHSDNGLPSTPPPTPHLSMKIPRGETIRRLTEKFENKIREDSEKKFRKEYENKIRIQMTGVLKNLQNGKESLKPISHSSPTHITPRQSFIKPHSNCGSAPGSIAEALKKKFENIEFDSPQSEGDNSFSQTFDDSNSEDSFSVKN